MTEFRDAIAAALAQPYCANAVSFYEASSVLAMPEMQAIRKFFGWYAHRHGTKADMWEQLTVEAQLPENVAHWIMDDAWPDEGSNP